MREVWAWKVRASTFVTLRAGIGIPFRVTWMLELPRSTVSANPTVPTFWKLMGNVTGIGVLYSESGAVTGAPSTMATKGCAGLNWSGRAPIVTLPAPVGTLGVPVGSVKVPDDRERAPRGVLARRACPWALLGGRRSAVHHLVRHGRRRRPLHGHDSGLRGVVPVRRADRQGNRAHPQGEGDRVVLTACPLCVRAFRVRVYVPAAVREALVV